MDELILLCSDLALGSKEEPRSYPSSRFTVVGIVSEVNEKNMALINRFPVAFRESWYARLLPTFQRVKSSWQPHKPTGEIQLLSAFLLPGYEPSTPNFRQTRKYLMHRTLTAPKLVSDF